MPGTPSPASSEAPDTGWLSQALGRTVAEVAPLGPIHGLTTTAHVARYALHFADASEPVRIAYKLTPAETAASTGALQELHYYRELASVHPALSPRCYYADEAPNTGGAVLILEDLGEMRPGHCLDGLGRRHGEAVVDAVADLHRAWWDKDELSLLPRRARSPEQTQRTLAAFDARWRVFESARRYAIEDALRDALPGVLARYQDDMAKLAAAPLTLIHGDLHVENLIVDDAGGHVRVVALDWQRVSAGSVGFDLGQLLSSLEPALIAQAPMRDGLLDRYRARLGHTRLSEAALRAQAAAAIRHQLVSGIHWFNSVARPSPREETIVKGHWERLQAAVLATAND